LIAHTIQGELPRTFHAMQELVCTTCHIKITFAISIRPVEFSLLVRPPQLLLPGATVNPKQVAESRLLDEKSVRRQGVEQCLNSHDSSPGSQKARRSNPLIRALADAVSPEAINVLSPRMYFLVLDAKSVQIHA